MRFGLSIKVYFFSEMKLSDTVSVLRIRNVSGRRALFSYIYCRKHVTIPLYYAKMQKGFADSRLKPSCVSRV